VETIVVMIHGEKKMVVLVETIIMGAKIIDSVEIIPETVVIIAEVNLKGKKITVVEMEVIVASENPPANVEIVVMIRSRVRLHHPRRETREVLGVRRHHSRKKKLSNQGWAELVVQLRLKR